MSNTVRVFGARHVTTQEWIIKDGRVPPEVYWTTERSLLETALRAFLVKERLPPTLWTEWFDVVELDMSEATVISERVRTGGKA